MMGREVFLPNSLRKMCIRDSHLDERAASLGGEFMESIRRISESHPGTIKEVRGLGLMIGIELAFPAKAVWEEPVSYTHLAYRRLQAPLCPLRLFSGTYCRCR